jgi:hypothetical protein
MSFKDSVIRSFQKAKKDHINLKSNITDWILFYNKKHNEMELRLLALESKLSNIEKLKVRRL